MLTPVIHCKDDIFLQHYKSCFFNPTAKYPKPETLNAIRLNSKYFCDSGGYQIYSCNGDKNKKNGSKRALVVPGVGIRNSRDCLILDPIDLCKIFNAWHIAFGFTLDHPLSDGASESEFQSSLSKSHNYAELMYRCKDKLCPKTKLLIPLHYLTKNHLFQYFKKMSPLEPDGYAFPVRNTNNWEDFVRVAYCLCFLYSEGAKVVHLLGSSRAEIIILGAAAIGLNMFDQISFDSTSWRTDRFGIKYFDTQTLKLNKILKDKIKIILPNNLVEEIKGKQSKLSIADKKNLILLHNILAIDSYKNRILEIAKDMKDLEVFIKTKDHLKMQRGRLLFGIQLLNEVTEYGFDFVDGRYNGIWEQDY